MITKDEQIKEALMALADMVGKNCAEGESEEGATLVCDAITSSSDEAIRVLCMHGFLKPYSLALYSFTDKAGAWGPEHG